MPFDDKEYIVTGGLAGPRAQTQWTWTIAAYLATLACGSGAYVAWQFVRILDPSLGRDARSGAVAGMALVLVSGLFVLLEIGRPLRFYLATLCPRSSWESRGFLMISAFDLLALLQLAGWAFELEGWDAALSVPATALALVLLVYGSLVLASFRPFALWTHPLQMALFPTSGLLAGWATLVIDPAGSLSASVMRVLGLGLVPLVALESLLLAALMLRVGASGPAGAASVRALTRGRVAGHFWLGAVGLGLVIPLTAATVVWLGGLGSDALRAAGVGALAGLLFHRHAMLASAHRPPSPSFRGLGPWAAGSS